MNGIGIETILNVAVVLVIAISTAAYGVMMIHVRYLSESIKDAHDRLDKHEDHFLELMRATPWQHDERPRQKKD